MRTAWPKAMSAVHASVGSDAYEAWFGSLQFEGRGEDGVVRLSAPTPFLKHRIEERYADVLSESFGAPIVVALRALGAAPPPPPPEVRDERSIRRIMLEDRPPPPVVARPPKPYAKVLLPFSVGSVVIATLDCYGLDRRSLSSERRYGPLVRARMIGMYVAHGLPKKRSLGYIAGRFGKKDHTTSRNAVRQVRQKVLNGDVYTIAEVENVRRQIEVNAQKRFYYEQ